MRKLDLKKGDTVVLAIERGSNASRRVNMSLENISEWTLTGEVVIVGRKYITVKLNTSWEQTEKFEVEFDYRQKAWCGSSDYKLYTSLEEIINERKAERICDKLQHIFRGWSRPKISLSTLEKIEELIDNEILS